MTMRIAAAVLALALCACAPVDAPTAPATPQAGNAQGDCSARGGRLERVGRAQTMQCVIPFADAGRACRDGSECVSGDCHGAVDAAGQSNVTGQCRASNMAFGCYTRVVNGRAESGICVD